MPIANEANSGGRHPAVRTSDTVASAGYTDTRFGPAYDKACRLSFVAADPNEMHYTICPYGRFCHHCLQLIKVCEDVTVDDNRVERWQPIAAIPVSTSGEDSIQWYHAGCFSDKEGEFEGPPDYIRNDNHRKYHLLKWGPWDPDNVRAVHAIIADADGGPDALPQGPRAKKPRIVEDFSEPY